MHNTRKINKDLYYIGCSDRRLQLFESAYPIPNGVSYNSYLLTDDKTALFDTVDKHCAEQFLENLAYALKGKDLDYLIVQHMEPDHASLIKRITELYPDVKILCTAKAKDMINQFFEFDTEKYVNVVK
ncbi:MBL fold metallo-hydrolase, partial [bacterium]|nr:MBL fold metallo-hydrolase [bacterium]